jgi:hypothetical protein
MGKHRISSQPFQLSHFYQAFNMVPRQLSSLPLVRQLLLPPVRVEAVAAAALAGVTEQVSGVFEVADIDKYDPYKRKIQ